MKVILVDDEPASSIVLSSLLLKYKDIEILGSYTCPLDALEAVKEMKPDVVFLDIEMGKVNGLEAAELFNQSGKLDIVFITAYSEYAVEAFEVNALDYLLKPIQERRLHRTIQRLKAKFKDDIFADTRHKEAQEPPRDGLIISSLGNFEVSNHKGEQIYWRTQKTKELFSYLWIHNGTYINKSMIMEVIFPDKNLSSATALLHTTVYQLRKALESLGFLNGIMYMNESYMLQLPIESDIETLNSIIGLKNYSHREIDAILEVYKGDFLEQEGYAWVVGIQGGLRESVYAILEGYAFEQLDDKEISKTLERCLELMYRLSPFSETMAKMTIEYFGIQHRKSELRRFFKKFADELWEEVGIRPMTSTIDLYREFLTLK